MFRVSAESRGVKKPADARAGAHVAAACAAHGVTLEGYGQTVHDTNLGQLVVADLRVARSVDGSVLAAAVLALQQDEDVRAWRSKRPVARLRWQERFSLLQ